MHTEKSKRKRILLILLSIALLLAIAFVVVSSLSAQPTALPAVTPRPTPEIIIREREVEKLVETEKTITAETIRDGLNEMGFLLTEEYYFTEVVSFSSIKKLLGIEWKFTESSFLASYDGVVEAGIDCTKITVEKDEEQKTILVTLPAVPEGCVHNAHMFYLKCRDLEERTALIAFLKARDILAVFHYVPLHSAPAGLRFGRFSGEDVYTTRESDRLVRLPLYYGLTADDQAKVIRAVRDFYRV